MGFGHERQYDTASIRVGVLDFGLVVITLRVSVLLGKEQATA